MYLWNCGDFNICPFQKKDARGNTLGVSTYFGYLKYKVKFTRKDISILEKVQLVI